MAITVVKSESFIMLVVEAETAPISIDIDGVARIGRTRVTLDTVVLAFEQGATAEEIASRYPALKLSDVYSTIAFYLNHQEDIVAYLQQRQEQGTAVRVINEQKFDAQALRARLWARRAERLPC
jgi:uncharacterized protein (DUF433 family)